MKKFLALIMVLALASVAIAEDRLSVNGRFNVRGTYDSVDIDGGDEYQRSAYDQDLRIYTKIKADDNTFVNFRFDMDYNWDMNGTDTESNEMKAQGVRVERAWLTHNFATGTTLNAGLLTGGAWGTDYTNNADAQLRIKLSQKIAMGKVVGYVQKNTENGNINGDEDLEKDDSDTYGLGAVLKFGDFKVSPLLVYVNNSAAVADADTDGVQTIKIRLSFEGKFGPVSVEGEVAHNNMSTDVVGKEDANATGLYLDANVDLGMATVGAAIAYTTYDDDAAYGINSIGDDFDDYMVVIDGFYDDKQVLGGYLAYNLVKVYATFTPAEKVTGNVYFTYAVDADESDNKFYELDVTAKYQFSKAFFYQAGFGYNALDLDGTDVDAYRVFHKVQVNF